MEGSFYKEVFVIVNLTIYYFYLVFLKGMNY
jgi:hypothetical protein